MRRDAKILLTTACLGAVATWGDTGREALVSWGAFHVQDVEVRGARYLSDDAVVRILGLLPGTSVWSDTDVWTERLLSHPLIKEVRVTRRLPDGLLVVVTERQPIALAPTPTLEPVDAEGYRLPIDPVEFRLDLPLIHTTRRPPEGSRLFPEDVRRLAAEVEHLMAADTAFLQLVSSVAWDEGGVVIARWTEPPVAFLLPPQAPPARLREGISALADAVEKSAGRPPETIDLRFADQVVVRGTSATGP
jgi:hypothetical protein